MDMVDPFERGSNEFKFAITLVEYQNKWLELYFTSTFSVKVIEFLKIVFRREAFID